MRLSVSVLRQYTDLPASAAEVRSLLDDVGVEVKRAETDDVFVVELLANRGDHYAYEGIAREVSARTGSSLRRPEWSPLEIGTSPIPLRLQTEHCLVYTATLLERSSDGNQPDLPADVVRPLAAAGIHSLVPPIDATNLSNLELGQPTHVFDADRVVGAIVVRLSRAGERAWPLFAEEHVEVPEGTLVIADEEKILAIAGVIGCEDSKTTETTTRILVESACFDPVKVRIASRAMGIHTDSTARFERGSDPERPLMGAGRVVHLLETHSGWRRVGTTGVVGEWTNPDRDVVCTPEAASAYLGISLDHSALSALLGRQGFTSTAPDANGRERWRVPSWRLWDVEFTADLYEELAKAVGYNSTPTTLPAVQRGALPSRREVRKYQVEDVLVGAGFYEVFTDGFYGRSVMDLLGVPSEAHPLSQHVETLNALDRDYSLLKNNALAQAVLAVAQNIRNKTSDIRLYEWTRTFHPLAEVDRSATLNRTTPPCTEQALLWMVSAGQDRARGWQDRSRPADVYFLKGILEEVATTLRLPLLLQTEIEHALSDFLHPGRQAVVTLHGQAVGILGEVHPAVLKRAKIKRARPCYLELSADLLDAAADASAYTDPSAIQPMERSLAFSLPPQFPAQRIIDTLYALGPDNLQSVQIVDRFDHEEGGTAMRAITYSLRFDNTSQTLTADNINATLLALQDKVVTQHAGAGVRAR